MIVVDSSAVLAVLLDEPEADRFARALEATREAVISAASVVEIGVVLLAQRSDKAVSTLTGFLEESSVRIEPFTAASIQLALDAYAQYGKRRGHPARLNLGDCFSYALAKSRGAPLLFKGNDFPHTDIQSVL